MKKFVVTGGLGFIGSHFIELILQKGYYVINIDKETYAANKNLPFSNHKNYNFIKADIAILDHLPSCDYVVNFAAESHVDNSIRANDIFIHTNVNGVHNLLELIRGKYEYERPVFIQISTDEVYGDISDGKHREDDLLKPSNPYSASKASADMLVMAWGRTYGIKYKITRSTNNYGIRQYPEKIIPKFIRLLLEGKNVTIHGSGQYVRDWLHVKDNCEAILLIINEGEENSIYNIAGECEMTNLELTKKILKFFNKGEDYIDFVPNRWGQDIRYSLDISKIKKLGWRPTRDFDEELEKLINWWKTQLTNERLES